MVMGNEGEILMGILDDYRGGNAIPALQTLDAKVDAALEERMSAIEGVYRNLIRDKSDSLLNHRSLNTEEYSSLCAKVKDLHISMQDYEDFWLHLRTVFSEHERKYLGQFISALVQNLYDGGNDSFTINAGSVPFGLSNLGSYLCGTPNRPIKLVINGSCSDNLKLGSHIQYADLVFNEKANVFSAAFATKSVITFNDTAKSNCAFCVEYCTVLFNGPAESGCVGQAKSSHIIFNGSVEEYCGYHASNCRFESPRLDVLQKIRNVSESPCWFYLLHPDGTSKEVKF